MFFDYAKIFLKSGDGGSGSVSFRREKYVPRGGPDGGDGGRGGHIIFKVTGGMTTLSDFRYQHHFKAQNGQAGGGANRTGKDGQDLYIPIPKGTVIRDAASHQILADLTEEGTEYLILQGGRGGRGNARFASATRQTPQIAEKGEPGRELWVELELKLIADVGLVGYPNVGKSTLISRISAAKPKIADYPFTTLIPNLGVVEHKGRSFVAVDIPGLIAGAHQGVGLGLQFLRHVERTRILVHLVDVSGLTGRDPYQDYLQINKELEAYSRSLADKPQIVALNKIDLPAANGLIKEFQSRVSKVKIITVSAATGEGIPDLLDAVIEMLDRYPQQFTPSEMSEFIPPRDDFTIKITRDKGAYVVQNIALERRIQRFNLNNDDSLRSFQRLIKRWKVEEALIEAGVQEGDTVRIAGFEFIYSRED
ncbi:MAG TPA: GTPase ObgE [Bacillota bacterium]